MHRRQVLASTGLLLAGVAGCSGTDPGDGTETATPVETTPDPATRTPAPTGVDHAAEQADPGLAVVLENRHDEPHALSLTVTREGGEVVHEAVHDLEPGEESEAYNLRSADPDGVERFTVAVELGDQRESVAVQTSDCYGDVECFVDAEGDLTATYSVC